MPEWLEIMLYGKRPILGPFLTPPQHGSSISIIPTELLAMIFTPALGGNPNVMHDQKDFKQFLNLSGVCPRWRTLAWSIPCSGISVNLNRCADSDSCHDKTALMRRFREEAGRCLSLGKTRKNFNLGIKGSYRISFDLDTCVHSLFTSFDLQITAVMVESEDVLIALLDSSSVYLSIGSMIVEHESANDTSEEDSKLVFARFGDVFPNLKGLSIPSRSISLDPLSNLKNLTSLSIGDVTDCEGTLCSFLQSLPAVEQSSLSIMDPLFLWDVEEDEWILPSLNYLYVGFDELYHHLRSASFPSLDFLWVWSCPGTADEPEEFLDEVGENLSSMIKNSNIHGITLRLDTGSDVL